MRWFYPEYLPRENQSRPDLPAMFPYERLSRDEKGHSPYATGDFAGHRSIYGGAYVMWLDKMIQAQGDPWLLRWDLGKTNFMDPKLPPAFLYYNPWPEEKRVTVEIATETKPRSRSDAQQTRGTSRGQGGVESASVRGSGDRDSAIDALNCCWNREMGSLPGLRDESRVWRRWKSHWERRQRPECE